MVTSRPLTCAAILIAAVFVGGCGGTDKAAAAATPPGAAKLPPQGDGVHQYRAVCTEKALHDGNEYVLTRWLDTKDEAQAIGDYHGWFKYRGHQVRIEERTKPNKTAP
jgi:hypothetical protein